MKARIRRRDETRQREKSGQSWRAIEAAGTSSDQASPDSLNHVSGQ